MHGHPPSITLMPRWRPYSAAECDTLPAPGPLCIQTRVMPRSAHSRMVASAVCGLVPITTQSTPPGMDATMDTVVTLADATTRGMVIMALATPGMATHRTMAAPFGAAAPEQWSLAALGIASIAAAFLEPDPAIEWDDGRLAAVRCALTEVTTPEA
jgi:hypothetical protein